MEKNDEKMIGRIVDMPIDSFKKEIVGQKVSIGIINNLILMLNSTYFELKSRKEAVLDLVFTHKKTKEEMTPVLEGLYAEMVKVEQKVIYLKERSKELLNSLS